MSGLVVSFDSETSAVTKDNTEISESRDSSSTDAYLLHSIQQRFDVSYEYPVCFTRQVFFPLNSTLVDCLISPRADAAKVLFVVDDGIVKVRPSILDEIEHYVLAHKDCIKMVGAPWVVEGGEKCKNSTFIPQQLYQLSQEEKICRHSYVVVIGGGAVIDAVGYAAATAHRGIRLIRMPTTVLGQNDAGVGVKNAINWLGRKNFVGTFVPPHAVVNDFEFIESLPNRDKTAGIAEAIKVSLISDKTFFYYLNANRKNLRELRQDVVEKMIVKCAELHLRHIRSSGDPFERGSARPLDFGHWTAHKLEELTNHSLNHGEAVAIGIALDTLYSSEIGLLAKPAADLVLQCLEELGFTIFHSHLESINIESALEEFREHLGGELCITLLTDIGKRIEVNDIQVDVMSRCVAKLKNRENNN